MSELTRFLLDLDALSLSDPDVVLGFERHMPLWMWVGLFALAALAAGRSYWRLSGGRPARLGLAGLRALLLATLITLLAGPTLIERQERTERDWALMLVDRSLSMRIADAASATGGRESRDDQLRDALARSADALRELSEHREVVWMGFDAGAYEIDAPLPTPPDDAQGGALELPAPNGRRSRLGAAIDEALRVSAARPLAGVVIASDGASTDEVDRASLRRLRQAGAPVHVLPLGSPEPLGDIAVRDAAGPGAAFVSDVAPVDVVVERTGPAAQVGATVRLVDEATGLTLDERRLDPAQVAGDRADSVTLTHRPEDAGQASWRVVVEPDGEDLIAENNAASVRIELIDRPLRTLYVDGYPRWEARYVKNLLLREGSITSTNLMLDPARTYAQESDEAIDRLPASPEEWAPFDVIALGDVKPGVFTREMLEQVRERVAERGGGLLLIGGPAAMPNRWWETPIADLLPFTRQMGDIAPHRRSVVAIPTGEASRLGVLRLGATIDEPWPEALTDPRTGWSQLRFAQRIEASALKPAATPLALAAPVFEGGVDGADATPLVITMRYGAGRVVYVATDEIWRWRYGRGETLPERFWLPLIRLLARESLLRAGRDAALTLSPPRADVDQPVQIRLELVDQSLIDLGLASVRVRVVPEDSAAGVGAIEITLAPGPEGRSFVGQWLPTEGGEYRVEVIEAALAGLDIDQRLRVEAPDDELRRPETNHALLASLAQETGGSVLAPEQLAELDALLPNRQLRFVTERREPLWDTPAALLAVVLLLTLEWVGRRLIRLI